MRAVNRRRFLQLAGGGVAATMLSDSIARALAIPANRATRSYRGCRAHRRADAGEPVVRSLLRRDARRARVRRSASGDAAERRGRSGTRPTAPPWCRRSARDVGNLALTFIEDLDHGWDGTHQMFNGGNWDQWLPAKTTTCMAHMQRSDLPFHYALADAFTVCDGYYCSMLGPTDPNRYYMWTGWDGNDGKGGGPVIANDELGYGWQTYPERLQAAGISWKIYQDIGNGLDAAGFWGLTSDPYIGNYGDNSLLYFFNYQNAAPGSPLYERARTGTDGRQRRRRLLRHPRRRREERPAAEVSWIVAPEAYTEHPAWPAGYGAWYTAGVLNALTSNPEVWSKTALLITFDENDGFFDHVVGPYPNVGGLAGAVDRAAGQRAVRRQGRDAGRLGRRRRTVRSRRAGAAARRLAVEQRRVGVLGDVRPHLADPLHRGALRRRRAEHHAVAARRLRRPDLGVRLRERVAIAFRRCRASRDYKPNASTTPPSYHPVPPAVGSVPTPGARRAAIASARLPLRRRLRRRPRQAQPRRREPRQARRPPPGTIADGPRRALQLHDRRRRQADRGARRTRAPTTSASTVQTASSATSPALLPRSLRVEVAHRPQGPADAPGPDGGSSRPPPRRPVVVDVADAYGPDRKHQAARHEEITVDTHHSGGWYDIALTTPSDTTFSYQLAGSSGVRSPV